MLKNLPQDKAAIRILKTEVGDISESDAKLAEMSKAIIIGFRVKISPTVVQFMKNDLDKEVKNQDIRYNLRVNTRRKV